MQSTDLPPRPPPRIAYKRYKAIFTAITYRQPAIEILVVRERSNVEKAARQIQTMPVTRRTRSASRAPPSPRALRARDANNSNSSGKLLGAAKVDARPKKTPAPSKAVRQAESKARPQVEVIVLSSDDDGDGDGDGDGEYKPPMKKKTASTKSSKGKSRSNAAEVVVTRNTDKISTSLTSRPSRSPSGSALMKEKDDALEKMEHELQIHRNNHEMDTAVINRLMAENRKLTEELGKRTRKDTQRIDAEEFEDIVSCEICTMRMWSPYMISECGHAYCESCLRDWFDTTYTQHIAQHPTFLNPPVVPLHMYERRQQPVIAAQIQQIVDEHWRRARKPRYTCPACRTEVKHKPVVVFKLKDVARIVGKAMGEAENPQRNPRRDGPFDAFFDRGYVVGR